jgi:hypothetical protein
MGTISFLPGDRAGRQAPQLSSRQPRHAAGHDQAPPGPELVPGHQSFLAAWFQKLARESAAPGHRGRYAVVRRGARDLGMVAVDADLGIWFTALAGCNPAEDCEHVRRIQRDLSGLGFRYSEHGTLASQYFGLLYAAYEGGAGARPVAPELPPPAIAFEKPAAAAANAATRVPARLSSVVAAWLAEPVGADREDRWQAGDGGRPGAAAVGRGEEVA